MSKKKKKPQRKQGHPAKVNSNIISLAHSKVNRGIDDLTPDFARWFELAYVGPGSVEITLAAVRDSMSIYADLLEIESVTDFDPQTVLAIVHGLVDREEHREDKEYLAKIFTESWGAYTLFLQDSGRWKYPEQELELLRQDLRSSQFSFNGGPGLAGLLEDDTQLDDGLTDEEHVATALAQFEIMPVVALGHAMAQWVAESKGRRWSKEDGQGLIKSAVQELDSSIPAGFSGERRELIVGLVFAALAIARVLNLDFEQPEPLENAEPFAQREGLQAFEATYTLVRWLLKLLLETKLESAPDTPNEEEVWDLTLGWLTAAQVQEPVRTDLKLPPHVEKDTWNQAHEQMRELVALGIVESGDHYSVPPVVAAILADLEAEMDYDPEDDDQFSPFEPELGWDEDEPKRPERTAWYTVEILQLKLSLRDAKPPIWRRVLVPLDLHLGDLHDIIQAAFMWTDSHEHMFQTGLRSGKTYGALFGAMTYDADEESTPISEVLHNVKDRLEYTYDFGDDWQVRIEVEKVHEANQEFLPRCTGGRRFAPVEDSGGIGGWEHKMQVMQDPKHPEYDEVREWLVETAFEVPDASEFYAVSVNDRFMDEF